MASAPPLPDVLSLPNPPAHQQPLQSPNSDAPRDDIPAPSATIPSPLRPPFPFPWPWPNFRSIASGCWLVNYQPLNSPFVTYDGTMRIESNSAGRTASGDLYQRPPSIVPFTSGPNPANGIPILRRNRYRYYVRVTQIDEFISFGNTFDLEIQLYKLNFITATSFTWVWDNINYKASMTWVTAPSGYPNPRQYAEGDLKNSTNGNVLGRFKMGWVSNYYRKAVVEIDTVPDVPRPLDNGGSESWEAVFGRVGYDMSVHKGDTNVVEPSGDGLFTEAECHAVMLSRRENVDLDRTWHYHLLCVKEFNPTNWIFGIMYDWSATDSNSVAREGLAIGADSQIPNDSKWGTEANRKFSQAKNAYLRTAIHELGHAFGLTHRPIENDNSFMDRTMTIISKSTTASSWPNTIKWNYADENLFQLRHWPDVYVRPGGVEFGQQSNTNPLITPADAMVDMDDLELRVEALVKEVPLGAPVRVNLTLTNKGDTAIRMPRDIGLRGGFTSGVVSDIARTEAQRTFKPLICYDFQESPLADLGPGKSLSASLTLLRGGQGALFPTTGIFEVRVNVAWEPVDRAACCIAGSTTVMVTPAHEESHAAAAHKILTTPDTHLVLVLGGDHLKGGLDAIQLAMKDKTLRPHFASIEAKRLAQKFQKREANVEEAKKIVKAGKTVASPAEKTKLEKLGVKW